MEISIINSLTNTQSNNQMVEQAKTNGAVFKEMLEGTFEVKQLKINEVGKEPKQTMLKSVISEIPEDENQTEAPQSLETEKEESKGQEISSMINLYLRSKSVESEKINGNLPQEKIEKQPESSIENFQNNQMPLDKPDASNKTPIELIRQDNEIKIPVKPEESEKTGKGTFAVEKTERPINETYIRENLGSNLKESVTTKTEISVKSGFEQGNEKEVKPEIKSFEKTFVKDGETDNHQARGLGNLFTKDEKAEYLRGITGKGIETAASRNNKEINPVKLAEFNLHKNNDMIENDEKNQKFEEFNGKTKEKPVSDFDNIIPANNMATSKEQVDILQSVDKTPVKQTVYNQIAEEIGPRLEKNQPLEFKMKLNPRELGEIDIKIKIVEGKLSIDIISAVKETQELLTRQVDKLTSKLGYQNFHVENIQVNSLGSNGIQSMTNQDFGMNFGMNFNNRRQQESLKGKNVFKIDSLKNTVDLLNENGNLQNPEEVKFRKFESNRMNYMI